MKTVILAGGYGTRLSEETDKIPKPMVQIGKDPILYHIMKIYDFHGYKDFIIALGYKSEVIKRYFYDLYSLPDRVVFDFKNREVERSQIRDIDWQVDLMHTGDDCMTGGRILRLKDTLKHEDYFMVTYGDGVANVNIRLLVEEHIKSGRIATITAVRPPARFGGLSLSDDNKVKEFVEKPQIGEGWINGGFMVFKSKVLDYIDDDKTILERSVFERLCAEGELGAYKHPDFWQPMDTLRDKISLNELWEQNKAPWKLWD